MYFQHCCWALGIFEQHHQSDLRPFPGAYGSPGAAGGPPGTAQPALKRPRIDEGHRWPQRATSSPAAAATGSLIAVPQSRQGLVEIRSRDQRLHAHQSEQGLPEIRSRDQRLPAHVQPVGRRIGAESSRPGARLQQASREDEALLAALGCSLKAAHSVGVVRPPDGPDDHVQGPQISNGSEPATPGIDQSSGAQERMQPLGLEARRARLETGADPAAAAAGLRSSQLEVARFLTATWHPDLLAFLSAAPTHGPCMHPSSVSLNRPVMLM